MSQVKAFKYGKEEAKMIGGIAIILMFIHHMFGFPDFLRPDVSWYGIPFGNTYKFEYLLAQFAKVCVALFAFNTGYAMYTSSTSFLNGKAIIRLLKFILGYWVCYLLFIVYGYFADETLPNLREFLLNSFGINTSLSREYINIPFAWYVSFYIICLLISPFIIRIFKRGGIIHDIILFISIRIVLSLLQLLHLDAIYNIQKDLWPLIMVIGGFLTAKYFLFEKLHDHVISRINTIWLFLILFCMIIVGGYMRVNGVSGSISELIFSIIIISFTLELFYRYRLTNTRKLLVYLGINSMILWYTHGIFFTGTRSLQFILYYSQIPVLIIITGFILTIPISLLILRIIGYINSFIDTHAQYCIKMVKSKA